MLNQAKNFCIRHQAIVFFVGGFVFDIFTLDRIDSLLTIVQQALYLLLLGLLLIIELVDSHRVPIELNSYFRRHKKYFEVGSHFIIGSLLSAYTLFFFKSASLSTSLLFMVFIAAMLIANEVPRFQAYGLLLRVGLFHMCVICYFSYLIPIMIGQIGFFPFGLAILTSSMILGSLFFLCLRLGVAKKIMVDALVLPTVLVSVVFVSFYVFQIIPPIPLSLSEIGVYHTVEKKNNGLYKLSYLRPWWKFWRQDSSEFQYTNGDHAHIFFRIFSPNNFKDSVKIHWLFKDSHSNWTTTDLIPISISGGRDQGYRGYAIKTKLQIGNWQVRVETQDGREIGRYYFVIEPMSPESSPETREFRVREV